MESLNRIILLVFVGLLPVGCGVKGVPLPPLKPAPLGRGEPTYSGATQQVKEKKKNIKAREMEESSGESQEGL